MTKLSLLLLAFAACGSAPAPVAPATPPVAAPDPTTVRLTIEPKFEVADSSHPTELQQRRLLGHYSTIDGKTGFVLDRTVDPPRMRLDGDPYIKILGVRPSVRCCIEYTAGNFWVRIDKDSGEIVEFEGELQRDPVRVVRDADAQPLPMP
jgi:hypothetical protein